MFEDELIDSIERAAGDYESFYYALRKVMKGLNSRRGKIGSPGKLSQYVKKEILDAGKHEFLIPLISQLGANSRTVQFQEYLIYSLLRFLRSDLAECRRIGLSGDSSDVIKHHRIADILSQHFDNIANPTLRSGYLSLLMQLVEYSPTIYGSKPWNTDLLLTQLEFGLDDAYSNSFVFNPY